MKWIVVVCLFAPGVLSQKKSSLDELQRSLSPVCAQARKIISDYNSAHPQEPKKTMWCSVSEPTSSVAQEAKTEPLTDDEVKQLDHLRGISDSAYEAQESFEKYLLKKHGVKLYDLGDPCWRYVGIKANDDFITYELHPVFERSCKEHSGAK